MLRSTFRTLVPCALLACSGLAAAATGLPWTSGFETGDTREWRDGYNKNDTGYRVVGDAAAVFHGDYGLRIPLRANYINDNYIELPFGDHPQYEGGRGDSVDDVWMAFRVKFEPSAGYDHSNFWISRSSHKIALLNLEDSSNQRRNQIYLYISSDGRFRADWSDIDTWTFHGVTPLGTPPRVEFGKWHRVKLHVKNNTADRSDGVVELWVDGKQVIRRTDMAIQRNEDTGRDKNVHPNLAILSSYTGMEDGGAGVQYFDDWYVGETDPDAAPPSAPRLLRIGR